jgi:hypothetical protein
MNYNGALELKDPKTGKGTGKRHFVSTNRREGTYPLGYCADHPGHDSPEEAQDCFRRYLLDGISETQYTDWTGCEVCDAPTKMALSTRPPYGHDHPLCDEHRQPERLEELEPKVGQIWGSW